MEAWRREIANRPVWKHLGRKRDKSKCRQRARRVLSLRGEEYEEYRASWTRKRSLLPRHRLKGPRVAEAREFGVRGPGAVHLRALISVGLVLSK